jgi:hypothetical protein
MKSVFSSYNVTLNQTKQDWQQPICYGAWTTWLSKYYKNHYCVKWWNAILKNILVYWYFIFFLFTVCVFDVVKIMQRARKSPHEILTRGLSPLPPTTPLCIQLIQLRLFRKKSNYTQKRQNIDFNENSLLGVLNSVYYFGAHTLRLWISLSYSCLAIRQLSVIFNRLPVKVIKE